MKKNDNSFPKSGINWYPGHMAKTKREIKENIKLIDIVYEVIDARLPLSSKINDIEDIIQNKLRILVMTKKDLCDINVTNKWISYYESKGYKVVCVDLNNNNDYKKIVDVTCELTKEIQDKRIKNGLKEKEIKALVIGIPNVGKSTLINKMVGKKASAVANIPGVTKNMTWLKTKFNILLLDTPGILWPKFENDKQALILASTGAIKSNILEIESIGSFIIEFLKDNYPDKINDRYNINIDNDDSTIDIIDKIASKIGTIKNNEVDYELTCKRIYNDVISGKITGVTFDKWRK